ncbi:kinetochore protein NDC80 homolog [Esox lucius]|uniref:Kinetochore protein NDC80 n=1 Tax=Esox lucius TaxID=8010 RepID=A0A3P9AH41_ESOLU|nr:kinetochore protein NDC80 homolog [Esox lucius]XP_010875325.1 kinetochore protein NDC80 homolog [Esox lucius]XP_010875326.1 kinetochore protein NDC80 homolog [Esox lucius]XP_019907821.1 kinetochore protein NDC80 homolog [Esox lucius]
MERSRMSRVSNSNRLSELPQRIENSRVSMVYATPQNKQPSFGKLNIPKPQSVSSDRRTSFFGSRTSGAGMARNSNFGTFGGVEKMKDPRPLHDKGYVQQCIRQLCEFLSEKGFSGLTAKSLQSPSTKEFLKMFEFIYCLLDPTFQMPTSKVEEEVPRILKDLGYPFALSKSSMYSVGAPHTWPQVLAAVIWLIDVVKIYCCESEVDLLYSDFSDGNTEMEEGVEFNKLFLDYVAETYNKFMQGLDTFDDEDEDYLHNLKKLYNVDEGHLASMEEKYRILSDELERLEKESQADRLLVKRNEKLKFQTDLEKLHSYLSELESFKANLDNKVSGLADELEASGLQLETLKQEQSRLEHILSTQTFTPADVERINWEKRELQQTINSLTKNLEQVKQHMWNEEITLAKIKGTADVKLAEYHKLARQLKLIPASAQNACGHNFEICTSLDYETSTMVEYRIQIQEPLRKLIADVEEECSRMTNTKLSLEDSIEQVNSSVSDKANDLKQLREQIRRLDEQLEQDMLDSAQEEQKWAAEVESVENHYKLLQKKVFLGLDEALEQRKAVQQQYPVVLQETKEESRTVLKNLVSVFTTAANHLSIVEKFVEDQHKRVDRVYTVFEKNEVELQTMMDMVESIIAKARTL